MSSLNDVRGTAAGTGTGKAYWRSLDEIADTPEFRKFLHEEFPAGAAEMLDSAGRRYFLRIMAASMALAGVGLSGCRRWPQEKIAPYANRPAGRMPGVAVHYATAMTIGGVSAGVLATSMDGRPIKIEPNRDLAGRGTSVFAQASVLDLYDPDRSRSVMGRDGDSRRSFTWAEFAPRLEAALKQIRTRRGGGLCVLSEASNAWSSSALRERLADELPRARWFEYEPINNDEEWRGTQLALGQPLRPVYDLGKARVIVALDSDFLFDHGDAVRHVAAFADNRRAFDDERSMNRLYAFESTFSLTGANADHRAAIRSADVALVTAWLAERLLSDASLKQFGAHQSAAGVLTPALVRTLEHALGDLRKHRGQGLVIAGRRQPAEVHALAHLMNYELGNIGATVSYTAVAAEKGHAASIGELAGLIDGGEVEALVIVGGNPVYDAPADLSFAEKLARVPFSVHLSLYEDETSQACTWHVNRAHYLEAWGDGTAYDGTLSLCQPLIEPLFGGRSDIELLAAVTADPLTEGYDIVRRTFQERTGAGAVETMWRRTLHDGRLAGTAATLESPRGRKEEIPDLSRSLFERWSRTDRSAHEIVFTTDSRVWDGRFANNGWLQELPDPLTKITWDNAAIVGPATAASLGLQSGDMVQVVQGGRSVRAAVFILPGQAEGSITLPLGYGRRPAHGRICQDAGFDFYALRTSGAMGFAGGATLQTTGERYPLATTQDHHSIDVEKFAAGGVQQRLPALVREATLEEYRTHPDFVDHRLHVVHRLSLWDDQQRLEGADYAWGMAIDLSACVGCNACVVACQAENNIPIVGKDQVLRGREMHWIRVDRYFRFETLNGRPDSSQVRGVAIQPVPCMHCENAPCEQVCPVAATVHDRDGLNVMVYNRCIGTRYCSNNCPYKVRRFNYFDYHRRDAHREQPGALLAVEPRYYTRPQAGEEPLKQLQLNPDVTVRVRGVMEKCTYCVQRIMAARIAAKNEWVKLPEDDPRRRSQRVEIADGAVMTACQEACPADAIVFGDLNDRRSRVAQLHARDRCYEMLEELNVKARTKYLARLTNPAFGGESEAAAH